MNAIEAAEYLQSKGLARSAKWVRSNVPGYAPTGAKPRRSWTREHLDRYLGSIEERPKGAARATAPRRREPPAPRRREKSVAEIRADLQAAIEGR